MKPPHSQNHDHSLHKIELQNLSSSSKTADPDAGALFVLESKGAEKRASSPSLSPLMLMLC